MNRFGGSNSPDDAFNPLSANPGSRFPSLPPPPQSSQFQLMPQLSSRTNSTSIVDYNPNAGYANHLNDMLDSQNDNLRRKKQDLEDLASYLRELEELTQSAHQKLIRHSTIKDELTRKSYDCSPLYQSHQDLLKQIESKCQSLTKLLREIDQNDGKVCNVLMEETNQTRILTTLARELEAITNDQVVKIINRYDTHCEELFLRIEVLKRSVIPKMIAARDNRINNIIPGLQTDHAVKREHFQSLQQDLAVITDTISSLGKDTVHLGSEIKDSRTGLEDVNRDIAGYTTISQTIGPFLREFNDIASQIGSTQKKFREAQEQITATSATNQFTETTTLPELQQRLAEAVIEEENVKRRVEQLHLDLTQKFNDRRIIILQQQYGIDLNWDSDLLQITNDLQHRTDQTRSDKERFQEDILSMTIELKILQQEQDYLIDLAAAEFDQLANDEIKLIKSSHGDTSPNSQHIHQYITTFGPLVDQFPELKTRIRSKMDEYCNAVQESSTWLQAETIKSKAALEQHIFSKNKEERQRLEARSNRRVEKQNQLQQLQDQIQIERKRVNDEETAVTKFKTDSTSYELQTQQTIGTAQEQLVQTKNACLELYNKMKSIHDAIIIPPPAPPAPPPTPPPTQVALSVLAEDLGNSMNDNHDDNLAPLPKRKSGISFNDTPHFQSPPHQPCSDTDDAEVMQNTLHNRNISRFYPDSDPLAEVSTDCSSTTSTPALGDHASDDEIMNDDTGNISKFLHKQRIKAVVALCREDHDTNPTTTMGDSSPVTIDNIIKAPPAPKQSHSDRELIGSVHVELIEDGDENSDDKIADTTEDGEIFRTPPRNELRKKRIPRSPKIVRAKQRMNDGDDDNDLDSEQDDEIIGTDGRTNIKISQQQPLQPQKEPKDRVKSLKDDAVVALAQIRSKTRTTTEEENRFAQMGLDDSPQTQHRSTHKQTKQTKQSTRVLSFPRPQPAVSDSLAFEKLASPPQQRTPQQSHSIISPQSRTPGRSSTSTVRPMQTVLMNATSRQLGRSGGSSIFGTSILQNRGLIGGINRSSTTKSILQRQSQIQTLQQPPLQNPSTIGRNRATKKTSRATMTDDDYDDDTGAHDVQDTERIDLVDFRTPKNHKKASNTQAQCDELERERMAADEAEAEHQAQKAQKRRDREPRKEQEQRDQEAAMKKREQQQQQQQQQQKQREEQERIAAAAEKEERRRKRHQEKAAERQHQEAEVARQREQQEQAEKEERHRKRQKEKAAAQEQAQREKMNQDRAQQEMIEQERLQQERNRLVQQQQQQQLRPNKQPQLGSIRQSVSQHHPMSIPQSRSQATFSLQQARTGMMNKPVATLRANNDSNRSHANRHFDSNANLVHNSDDENFKPNLSQSQPKTTPGQQLRQAQQSIFNKGAPAVQTGGGPARPGVFGLLQTKGLPQTGASSRSLINMAQPHQSQQPRSGLLGPTLLTNFNNRRPNQ